MEQNLNHNLSTKLPMKRRKQKSTVIKNHVFIEAEALLTYILLLREILSDHKTMNRQSKYLNFYIDEFEFSQSSLLDIMGRIV